MKHISSGERSTTNYQLWGGDGPQRSKFTTSRKAPRDGLGFAAAPGWHFAVAIDFGGVRD